MHIRHLPGETTVLIDSSKIAPNNVLFNPSADQQYIYIRANAHTAVDENNYIIIYDETKKTLHNISSACDHLFPTANLFKGIEDLRIVVYNDQVWFTATSTHASLHMTNELLLGCFDKELKCIEKMSTVDIGVLPVKNVCPFVWNGKLHLLDSYLQKIYEVTENNDPDTTNFINFTVDTIKSITFAHGIPAQKFRGSTSPVHLHGNTWGFIVHDIIFNDNERLVTRLAYYHYWVEIDMDRGVITFVSSPFWCAHWGIEYISGIRHVSKDPMFGNIELFIGINDKDAVRYTTTIANLRCGK
jgi:hypothetical protein